MSNWWGQPRPDGSDDPVPVPVSAHAPEPEPSEAPTGEQPEAEPAQDLAPEPDLTPAPELVPQLVATADDLPTMAQLDALSAELDEIDAALAAMDADPSLLGRAAAQHA